MLLLKIALATILAVVSAYMVRHIIFSLAILRRRRANPNMAPSDYRPFVSILIPAHNEEAVIGRILKRMTELTYPKDRLEVIAIDHASTDATPQIMESFASRYEFIKVVHILRPGGGKQRALNSALPYARGEIIIVFDADYYPQRDVVERLVSFFADPEVGVVQGAVVVENEDESLLTRLVAIERIGGYFVDQEARDWLRLVPQYGGTVGAFRRELIEQVGGFDPNVLAEDTDLTFLAIERGWKVRYTSLAKSFEEAVRTYKQYWRQRTRWAIGHLQCMFKHFWPVIRTPHLSVWEKLDALLLLCIFLFPALLFLGWVLGGILYVLGERLVLTKIAAILFGIGAFASVGNFAPFFESAVGLIRFHRTYLLDLLPLLFINFILNAFICTWALIQLSVARAFGRRAEIWFRAKTARLHYYTLATEGGIPNSGNGRVFYVLGS
ncbi:glycosyltransferase family 2 protein [archaeon]|nr:glycosyltransferase family 2 protein [archaeon]